MKLNAKPAFAATPRVVAATVVAVVVACALTMVPTLSVAEENEQLVHEQFGEVTQDGTASKQEVVYAKLSEGGQAQSLYVVNVFEVEAGDVIQDYGSYQTVSNLSSSGALLQTSDAVTMQAEEGTFSYQGDAPANAALPWNVEITYTLDGQQVQASDLAGASGELELTVATSYNEAGDSSYYDNYLLTISITMPEGAATSVKTEDGSVALSGSDTQVTFMALPGKDSTSTLTASISDFEMDGIQIAAIPFAMNIDLSETEEMLSQFSELSEATASLAQGSEELASGLSELNEGASTLSSSVESYVSGVRDASNGYATLYTQEQAFAKGLQDFATTLQYAVGSTEQGQQLVSAYSKLVDSYSGSTNSLLAASGNVNTGLSTLSQNGTALSQGASELASGATLSSEGAASLSEGATQLAQQTQDLPQTVQEKIDSLLSTFDTSDFTQHSFVDSRNANVELVQFVMATDAIEAPEAEEAEEPEQEQSLLDKFFALFS